MNRLTHFAAFVVLGVQVPLAAQAANGAGPAVHFAAGQTTTQLRGSVQGDADATFVVDARAGQTLSATLSAKSASLNFNISAPGAMEALFIGSVQGADARVLLPADGLYRVQVYLVRSAARRNERAAFTLQLGVSGQPLPPLAGAQDALVPGTRFHATATVPCRMPGSAADAQCQAGVIRRGRDGTATVELRGAANDMARTLLFMQGKPVASDSAQPLSASRQGDVTTVRVGNDERYELPDALLTGG
ncbi:MAG: hypothetical protein ACK4PH_11885 [Aquincola tertiaricarbonis]